ncbi:TPA: phage antirepressor, partial [Enterococcus faecium]|nr:phage antirepressor [Enterococcus faecium]
KFKRWVTSEVLPTIRKTGSYSNVPQSFAQALRLAADLEEKNQLLEQQIAEYEPKISYLDTILSSTDTVATSQIAADYGMSAIALNKLLNELGVQHKVSGQWILYRKHMNQGYTKSHTSEIPKADGGTKVVMNTKWTQKGRVFIYNLLIAEGYYPQMDLEEIG